MSGLAIHAKLGIKRRNPLLKNENDINAATVRNGLDLHISYVIQEANSNEPAVITWSKTSVIYVKTLQIFQVQHGAYSVQQQQ